MPKICLGPHSLYAPYVGHTPGASQGQNLAWTVLHVALTVLQSNLDCLTRPESGLDCLNRSTAAGPRTDMPKICLGPHSLYAPIVSRRPNSLFGGLFHLTRRPNQIYYGSKSRRSAHVSLLATVTPLCFQARSSPAARTLCVQGWGSDSV